MLKFCNLLIGCLISILFAGQASAAQSDATCFKHEAYLLTETLQIKKVAPCDFIGALYIYGLKGTTFMKGNERIPDEYQFYSFTRTYLAKQKNYGTPTDKERKTLTLLAYMAVTALSDLEISISDRRKNTYKSFLLREMFNENLDADSDVVGIIHSYMGVYAAELGFETWSELSCFVLHDIPTLTFEQILNSETYLQCKEEKNAS